MKINLCLSFFFRARPEERQSCATLPEPAAADTKNSMKNYPSKSKRSIDDSFLEGYEVLKRTNIKARQ